MDIETRTALELAEKHSRTTLEQLRSHTNALKGLYDNERDIRATEANLKLYDEAIQIRLDLIFNAREREQL